MIDQDMWKFGNVDMALTSFGAWSKGAQAIAAEVADYSKRTAECSVAAWKKLLSAKSLEKAMEVQSEYLKSSYEDFVAQTAKLGGLYAELAKDTYKEAHTYKEAQTYKEANKLFGSTAAK